VIIVNSKRRFNATVCCDCMGYKTQ